MMNRNQEDREPGVTIQDRCCVCGLGLNLAAPHDFDREKGAPKHRECGKQKPTLRVVGGRG